MKNCLVGPIALMVWGLLGSPIAAQDSLGTNNLSNGDFSSGLDHWVFQLNGGGAGGQATATVESGVLHIGDISSVGTQVYSIQTIQAPITVVKGVRYHLQFDARAAKDRPLNVKIGGTEGRSWADYTRNGNGAPFQISTAMKTYAYDFEMAEATDKGARIEFSYGLDPNSVWIDNVSFGPRGGELTRDGTLQNGNFAQDASYWDVWASQEDWSGVGELKLLVKRNELTAAASKVGSIVSNPKITQTGLVFEKGKSYQVSFYARADKNREIQVDVGTDLSSPPFFEGYAPPQIFSLGAASQPYSFTFLMRADTPENGKGKIMLSLGTIHNQAIPANVTLSRIQIAELNKPVVDFVPLTDSERITNGNFEVDTQGWTAQGAAVSVEKDELKAVVQARALKALVSTGGLKLAKGQRYLLSFTAHSSDERTVGASLVIPGQKAFVGIAAKLGAKVRSFQTTLEAPADADANLVFDLGRAGTVWLDRVSLHTTGAWMDATRPSAERVKLLMAEMTLAEKTGQMVQAERSAVKVGDIQNYGIGSVLSGGGSVPASNTPQGWVQMFNHFQGEALGTRLSIPLLYGIDAVHGHGNVYGATIFPHNIGLGATRDPQLMEQIGATTAMEVAATGLNWTFGPCVAVTRDVRWGRVYESFGESPELQNLLTGPYVKGLQGVPGSPDWMKGPHVVGTAKHFLGDGGAEFGTGEGSYTTDRGDVTKLNLEELKALHAQGYVRAIEQGVGTIMASFSRYQGSHMHGNKALLTDYLKAPVSQGGLGFPGFIIGDWDAVSLLSEVTGDYENKIVMAFNAGLDMSMEQSQWQKVIDTLQAAAEDGRVTQGRIDDAVRRILTVKFDAGVFDHPWALDTYADQLGTPAHRAVAARAVKESLVLLKNENNVLPLKKNAKIFVAGPLADNVGWQSGGWTLQWQGGSDRLGSDTGAVRLTPGTSILDGLKALAKAGGGEIVTDPGKAKDCSVAVVVVGETPYSEGVGDVSPSIDMTLKGGKAAPGNREAIQKALDLKLPLVVVMVSGRPLIVTDEIRKWDAFVEAWLPGTEGGAIAEVLYGKENFRGTLPVTWPRSVDQLPLHVGDPDYGQKKPLFPYGFGLRMKL